LRKGGVGGLEFGVEDRLVFGKDWVEVLVLGNALECNMRDGLVDEAADDARLLVAESVVVELCGEEPLTGDGLGDAAGVNGDPAPTPLLRDVSRHPRTAGRIEDEIAGVGGHQHTSFENLQ